MHLQTQSQTRALWLKAPRGLHFRYLVFEWNQKPWIVLFSRLPFEGSAMVLSDDKRSLTRFLTTYSNGSSAIFPIYSRDISMSCRKDDPGIHFGTHKTNRSVSVVGHPLKRSQALTEWESGQEECIHGRYRFRDQSHGTRNPVHEWVVLLGNFPIICY
jgi:hypothetical protein